jgi:hypothetical protein
MKIPPYITKGEIETTIKLGHDIRSKDGISAYLLFKKLCTVAMYGEMITSKIKYHSLISEIKYYWKSHNTFIGFWGYDTITPTSSSKVFMIYDRIIKYGTMLDVEREIHNNILFNKDITLDRKKLKMLYEHSK